MSTPAISGLAGLVSGYTRETDAMRKEELDRRAGQRDLMVQYLGHLATNPNVPPEHQQWALGKVQELIAADPSKKLPKVDLGELPPASVPGYTRQQTSQAPQMTLQPPVGPGGGQPSPQQAPAAAPAASSVGRASDNTVNALGAAIQPPIGPAGFEMPVANVRTGQPGPVPGTVVGGIDQKGRPMLIPDPATQPNFNVAPPTSSLTIPAGPATTIQNPVPPVPISPKGQLHVLTPRDKAAYATATAGQEAERLRQQYPGKSPEDLAYFAKHGEFPKDEFSLSPGEARYKGGKEVARNTAAKPGQKTGFSYEHGPSGEVLIKDNTTGATLSEQEIQANTEAKAVYATAQKAVEAGEKRQDERDQKKFENAQTLADQAFERAAQKKKMDEAQDAAKKARPMVDVLDTSEEYMKAGEFTPRQDLALIVRAVRAMNPGTVRLPQTELELELKAGSYGDRFKRWFTTASEGVLPDDQRQDLMNVIRAETTRTATTAAEDWRAAYHGTKEADPPTYLQRFETKPGDNIAPEGAEHEVYVDGKLVGHVVGKKFVPLGKGK